MCGICGMVGADVASSRHDDAVLSRLSSAIIHRGPDDHGEFRARHVALDARRLSIVDVEGGHQPFSDESGHVVAVQNGEIYNHVELRAALEGMGHKFRSRCDTEVIPHLYRRYGLDFADRLRGMFAIALWDGERDRAVLIRDRLGIKPLYYAQAQGRLLFASELKCLVSSGIIPLDLDYEAISAYLELGYFPAPRTPLAAVSKLPAGHRLVMDCTGHRVEQWWRYPLPEPGPTSLGVRHYAEGLLEHLDEAVRYELMSDVPFGAMLSGGLDSSLVVALMAPRLAAPVKTFSVGFKEDPHGNELPFARRVAELFSCEHHEVELSMVSDTVDFSELAWHLDEPIADLSALGFYALSELAADNVTMALSGQGADELLGGYKKHYFAATLDRAPTLARIGGGMLPDNLATRLPGQWRRILRCMRAEDPASRLLAMSGLPTLDEDSFRGGLATVPTGAGLRSLQPLASRLTGTETALPAALFLDAQAALPDSMLAYFDRMSMAHSLEVRVPFLDHRLVDFCATIPAAFKVRGAVTKYVLKEAARELLPSDIVDRKKIGFFRQATRTWFEAQIDGVLTDVLLDPGARYLEFVDRSVVEGIIVRVRRSGDEDASRALIALLMLELWLVRFLPRSPAP
jgi:asparagine synthase (glutamine-hydrolysing)